MASPPKTAPNKRIIPTSQAPHDVVRKSQTAIKTIFICIVFLVKSYNLIIFNR